MTMADTAPPLSLLSLSLAASQREPLPPVSPIETGSPATINGHPFGKLKPRRLSSASSTRRRINDAREAGIRNSQTISGLSNAAAALSLSSSPPVGSVPGNPPIFVREQSLDISSTALASSVPTASAHGFSHIPVVSLPKVTTLSSGHQSLNGILSVGALEEVPQPSSAITGSKKKGTIFRCESCSKVYRHPSCLVKHRWEHSPHWKEANKFLLSKHQQVQLLEAAAILSHITPGAVTGSGPATSLPDDRSLWPSYLASYVHPLSVNGENGDQVIEDDGERDSDEEAIEEDDEEPVDIGDLKMDFDSPPPPTSMGPLSSSVPTSVLLNSARNGGHTHHRTRSRSRSVSKSIHRNVLLNFGRMKKDDPTVALSGSSPGAADPKPMTLRPGLIAVPAPSAIKDEGNVTPGREWKPSSGGSNSIPISLSHRGGAGPVSIGHSFASSRLSMPRSSLRSSSGFLDTTTEVETDDPLSNEEDNYGHSEESEGSSGKGKRGKDQEWDGMEMEMDIGF